MKVRVLGCSGGIGGRHLRTTSFLVDHDVLIDGGTGVGDLSLAELAVIDHVFVTHSHLDHIACIPLLVDTVGDMRNRPLTLYATEATLQILKNHVFNWSIWPDFSEIPSVENPVPRATSRSAWADTVTSRRAPHHDPAGQRHTVPAVGYQLDSGAASLVFTGDTTHQRRAVEGRQQEIRNLRYLVIETAFSNREKKLAIMSKHLCPEHAKRSHKLQHSPEVFVTHLKPGQIELTMQELEENIGDFRPRMLQNNHVFEFWMTARRSAED
ncbi:MAG: 3',5'-cyclic-nucleotide phosphodiesterase [Comamonadaceae bacterium]|nr:3',5'-cyclic-nucleotide phosphodiesterase [Comamonadaceae bacterium]